MYSRNIDDIETILKETKPFDGETKVEIFHKAISNFLIDIVERSRWVATPGQ
jgi:hypothetical protein